MIRVHRPSEDEALAPRTRAALKKRGKTAKKWPAGDKQIQKGWKNYLRSRPHDDVRDKLRRIFRRKCAYCEAVVRTIDIDHFYPKSRFPKRMFRWDNFLLTCKYCNQFKHDHFPLESGRPVFINPCDEEPLDFLWWDYLTGAVVPQPNSAHSNRGRETCRQFQLDSEPLRAERLKKLKRVLNVLARATCNCCTLATPK